MNKQGELAVLDRVIGELGEQSYLGPWLASVRAEVERDVRSDLQPAYLPSEAAQRAVAIVAAAEARGAELVAQAGRRALELLRVASDDSARIRAYAATALHGALATLEGRRP